MVVTNYARERVALFIGNSGPSPPTFFIIGSGSGTSSITQTELIAPTDKQAVTATTYPAVQKVTRQGDWNSVEISGLDLKEFGIVGSEAGLAGSVWSRTSIPSVAFDGTNELRIETTWEVF